ncbi:hypothetical protein [Streptomyces sp. NPDC005573]|uniref:hypothetical protein n=1 Tax=Streptomyces sp. NPDC005573 TaxID=3156890 RepID=UPI0033A6DBAD
MMKKVLATAALAASAAAALGAPAHADDHWTATGTTKCAAGLAVVPALKAVSPLPLSPGAPECGEGSLLHQGKGH